jgi:hypothetical protein
VGLPAAMRDGAPIGVEVAPIQFGLAEWLALVFAHSFKIRPFGPISVLMSVAKLIGSSLFLVAAGMSCLTAGQTPSCSTNAPCFTIANRLRTAGLAVKSTNVASVHLNGRALTKGTTADYDVQTVAKRRVLVIVHMPVNTTGKPETFQVIYNK